MTTDEQSQMIVDFPPCVGNKEDRAEPILHKTTAHVVNKPSPQRNVRFSKYSTLVVLKKHESSSSDCWYTREEQAYSRKRVVYDAYKLRMVLDNIRNDPRTTITQDDIDQCIGVENFLCRESAQILMRKKKEHVAAVLLAQRIHGGCGAIEKIRVVSEHSSRWSMKRAATRAAVIHASLSE